MASPCYDVRKFAFRPCRSYLPAMSSSSSRIRSSPAGFIDLPSNTGRQAAVGVQLDYEIKHDGYRLMARRDPVGIRLLTRNGMTGLPGIR